jgi:hypothetical protein
LADNDDDLPDEICRIVEALARAAAKRDHHAAVSETGDRD